MWVVIFEKKIKIKKIVKYRKKYQNELILSSRFDKMSSIFLGHFLHALCRFNAYISLLSNHLAHLYHVPSIIAATDKLFRASESLLVIIPINVLYHKFVPTKQN
jgi:hypothetical protein